MFNFVMSFFSNEAVPIKSSEYQAVYDACKLVESRKDQIETVCERIKKSQARYQAVSDKVGLPWYLIAAIHYRESNCNFYTHMANGDPLFDSHGHGLLTVHVPKGKGPYKNWEESAIDSLGKRPMFKTIGECLQYSEVYNGLGYRKKSIKGSKGIPSPYVWAGTDYYRGGKYVADGVFNMNVWDKQLGCAAIFKGLGL